MLFKILGAPLTMPIAGLTFVFQQVADMANQELYDEGGVREQLLLLQVLLEEGDIDEDEFAEREAELLARLREIKERMCTEVPAQPDPTSLIDGGRTRGAQPRARVFEVARSAPESNRRRCGAR